MSSSMRLYIGVYLQIFVKPTPLFRRVVYCPNRCGSPSQFLSLTQKFCGECGAPALQDSVKDGETKAYVGVPDELEHLWFSPQYDIEALNSKTSTNELVGAWMPNFKDSPFCLSTGQAASISPEVVQQCLNAFSSSQAGKLALDYLKNKGFYHQVCFGAFEFQL